MAETVTSKAVCNSCGVDVRPGSMYCFSCGKSIIREDQLAKSRPNNGGHGELVRPEKIEVVRKPGEHIGTTNEVKVNVCSDSKPDLRSAASLRRTVKAYNRKPVEVIWTERDRFPTAYFIASVILVVFSAAMLILAWLLK